MSEPPPWHLSFLNCCSNDAKPFHLIKYKEKHTISDILFDILAFTLIYDTY